MYFKKLLPRISDWLHPTFKTWATRFVEDVLRHFSDYEFYCGCSDDVENPQSIVLHLHVPRGVMIFFKDGIEMENY